MPSPLCRQCELHGCSTGGAASPLSRKNRIAQLLSNPLPQGPAPKPPPSPPSPAAKERGRGRSRTRVRRKESVSAAVRQRALSVIRPNHNQSNESIPSPQPNCPFCQPRYSDSPEKLGLKSTLSLFMDTGNSGSHYGFESVYHQKQQQQQQRILGQQGIYHYNNENIYPLFHPPPHIQPQIYPQIQPQQKEQPPSMASVASKAKAILSRTADVAAKNLANAANGGNPYGSKENNYGRNGRNKRRARSEMRPRTRGPGRGANINEFYAADFSVEPKKPANTNMNNNKEDSNNNSTGNKVPGAKKISQLTRTLSSAAAAIVAYAEPGEAVKDKEKDKEASPQPRAGRRSRLDEFHKKVTRARSKSRSAANNLQVLKEQQQQLMQQHHQEVIARGMWTMWPGKGGMWLPL